MEAGVFITRCKVSALLYYYVHGVITRGMLGKLLEGFFFSFLLKKSLLTPQRTKSNFDYVEFLLIYLAA